MLYIQPGEPTQNASFERFNRTARHEWLDMHLFHSVAHAQLLATQWLWSYHNERPKRRSAGLRPGGCKRQLRLYAKPPLKMGGITGIGCFLAGEGKAILAGGRSLNYP